MGSASLAEMGCEAVLELSPHPVLGSAVAECYQHRARSVHVLPSLRRHDPERATMLRALGFLYTLGYPIDWSGVLPGDCKFVRLPLYSWQRQRFWVESEESRVTRLTAPAHPLLGSPCSGPRPAWETRLDPRLFPYLGDHRIQRAVILPTAAYVDIALAAAREVFGQTACQLEDVELAAPCFPTPDQALRLHDGLPARRWHRAHPYSAAGRGLQLDGPLPGGTARSPGHGLPTVPHQQMPQRWKPLLLPAGLTRSSSAVHERSPRPIAMPRSRR